MNWKIKSAMFWAFQYAPFGDRLYYLTQRYVTRSVPRISEYYDVEDSQYYRHIVDFREFFGDISDATYFEFGAGWDLLSNIIMYCYGIHKQFVFDIIPLAKPILINHVIRCIAKSTPDTAARKPDQQLGDNWQKDLLDAYGILYKAPADARKTGMPSGSIDLIGTAHTFEHIPWNDLEQVMKECSRLCNDRSVIAIHINYADHYSSVDSRISPYNFLQFSDRVWQKYSPPSQYHNRKRHVDFVRLFEGTGFEILKDEPRIPADGRRVLESLPIAEEFKNYTVEELLPTSARFVLKKRR